MQNYSLEDQENINEAFWKLEKYLSSWRTKEGYFNGIMATFWDWSLDTIAPHTMNHYPIILGYIELFKKFNSNTYLVKAESSAKFYLTHQDKNGQFLNAWADIPPKHTGPILQICPDIALLELYKVTGKKLYLDTVNKNVEWLFKNWWRNNGFYGSVVNQTCKGIEMFLLLYEITRQEKYAKMVLNLGEWVLTQQVQKDKLGKGGFYQSIHDDRLIIVYNAKVAPALIKLYQLTGDEKYKNALENLIKFILRNINPKNLFYSHLEYNFNIFLTPITTFSYKITKFTPLLRNKIRYLRRLIFNYCIKEYPMWIARSADTINTLIESSKIVNIDNDIITKLIKNLLSYQYENGGFPNTIGYFGNPNKTVWQDIICSIRWNAYCFLLLSKLVSKEEKIDNELIIIKKEYQENNGLNTFIETKDYIEWRDKEKIIKHFNKH